MDQESPCSHSVRPVVILPLGPHCSCMDYPMHFKLQEDSSHVILGIGHLFWGTMHALQTCNMDAFHPGGSRIFRRGGGGDKGATTNITMARGRVWFVRKLLPFV